MAITVVLECVRIDKAMILRTKLEQLRLKAETTPDAFWQAMRIFHFH